MIKLGLLSRLRNKSKHSIYTKARVVAVGLNAKNEVIGIAVNKPAKNRFVRGTHAEAILIDRYGKTLSTILIARFGRSGSQLPIDACPMCTAYAQSMGIKIVSIPIAK